MRKYRLTNRLGQRAETAYRSILRPTNGRGWYRLRNLAGGVGNVEIYIYDEIGLWGVAAADFVRELQYLEAVHIDLRINSPGGDVWDGIAIYNALCNHPASVTTYIDGLAASAASFIAQAGGKVLIARNGTMMIHDAEGVCIGNAADMQEMAELLDRTSNNIADIYAQRCSTVNQWRKAMRALTWYVGQEAVDSGLADDVYESDPGSENEPAERRRKASNSSVPTPVNSSHVPRPISTACPIHHSVVTGDGEWDPDSVASDLKSPVAIAIAEGVYTWYDSGQVEDGQLPTSACMLPHHVVDDDGTAGSAHIVGVQQALDDLDKSDIPEGDREQCRAHLQAHLDDASKESDKDIDQWWDPDVFKAAVATAADLNSLYGFDAEAFKEIMRAASENCPSAPEPVVELPVAPVPVPVIDQKEFLTALRKGLL